MADVLLKLLGRLTVRLCLTKDKYREFYAEGSREGTTKLAGVATFLWLFVMTGVVISFGNLQRNMDRYSQELITREITMMAAAAFIYPAVILLIRLCVCFSEAGKKKV